MPRVVFFDRRTHAVLLEGECSLSGEEIRALLARHEVTAVDAVPEVVAAAPVAPAAPSPRPSRKERKAS